MTTSHTVAAILFATGSQLVKLANAHKKETGEQLFALSTDLGNGVTFRELKSWLKDFKAKQASVEPKATAAQIAANGTKPAPTNKREPSKLSTISAAINPKSAANNVPAVEFKTSELKGFDLLIGRKSFKITNVVKAPEGNRVAILDSGVRVPVENIERNNRGNLRVKAEVAANVPAAKAPVVKTPAVKPANIPAAHVELKRAELIDQPVLIGRVKETIVRIVRDHKLDVRVVVTDKGSRILLAYIERNNRGNLRVKPGTEEMAVQATREIRTAKEAGAKVASAKPANKPAAKVTPVKEGVRQLAIESSNLNGASYEKARKVLTVTFKNGAVWEYKNVSIREVNALEKAESQGKFFVETIKSVKDAHCVVKGVRKAAKV